jgi:hypothetical protein
MSRHFRSRKMGWTGHVTLMAENINSYTLLVGKPEGNRIIKRPRPKGECNIKINVKVVGL